jgi:hypothetical protein
MKHTPEEASNLCVVKYLARVLPLELTQSKIMSVLVEKTVQPQLTGECTCTLSS